jgi:hypothetical protein
MLDLKKKVGDRVQFYSEVGWGRTVSIGEHPSLEEYAGCLQSPMSQAGLVKYETYPLFELDEKTIQAYVDSL